MSTENRNQEAPEVLSARAILFACFFFSGVTGLVYEIIWVRLFSFVFGNTVYSAAAVLGAFMGGLGAGGWWAGRFIEKRKDSILYYAGAEVLIGLYAFVPGLFIALMEKAYPAIYAMSGGSTSFLVVIKFVAAFVVLALPTFCMGATLPLMSRFFINSTTKFGSGLSLLYGLNTLGAVCGTFLAGFIMLRFLGIHDSLVMVMIVNLGIGVLGWVQYKKVASVEETCEAVEDIETDVEQLEEVSSGVGGRQSIMNARLMIAGTFTAGFVSLLLEVAWSRGLALIIGSTVYSFTLMLITFLLGISLGSLAIGRFLRKRPGFIKSAGPGALGITFLGIAVAATSSLFLMKLSINVFALLMKIASGNYSVVLVFQFLICALILFIPAFLFGIAFPLAAALHSECSSTISSGLGRIYFWNTFGAIAGSVLTGFALIPFIGVHKTLVLGSILMLVAGIVLVLPASGITASRRIGLSVVAVVVLVLFVTTQKWDRMLMTSGPFIYYGIYEGITERPKNATAQSGEMLYYGDGMTCTVTVRRSSNGAISLQVNGKTDASTKGDELMQSTMAVVPGLLHENPSEIAIIGFGSGMTVGAALQFPEVKKVDVIEIEPKVLEAGAFFKDYNYNALEDPRTNTYIEDGRNFFLTHTDQYDIIISEPSNHWIAGIASLYTQDFLRQASGRLKPGGLYVQWIQSYKLAPFSLRMFLKTFHSVFPHVNVFLVSGELMMIGSFQPLDMRTEKIVRRFEQVDIDGKINAVLGTSFSGASVIPGMYVAGTEEVEKLSLFSDINTDDRLTMEFVAPFEYFSSSSVIGKIFLQVHPVDVFEKTGMKESGLTADRYYELADRTLEYKQDRVKALSLVDRALALDPDHVKANYFRGGIMQQFGRMTAAAESFRKAFQGGLAPEEQVAYLYFLMSQGADEEAENVLARMDRPDAQKNRILYAEGRIYEMKGKHLEAADSFLRSAKFTQNAFRKAGVLFAAYESMEKTGAADNTFKKEILNRAIQLAPQHPEIAMAYASMLRDNGEYQQALQVLGVAERANPDNVIIRFKTLELQNLMLNHGQAAAGR